MNGLIIARLQPIHNGHLYLIEQSMRENENTVVFVGSADKFNSRNPIPIELRVKMANEACEPLREKYKTSKLTIVPLPDLTDESDNSHDWGFYIYSNAVKYFNSASFTIYYSDGFEIITTWFPSFLMRNFVSLNLIARGDVVDGVSATKVREYIMDENDKLKEVVPSCVYEKREILKTLITVSKHI